MNTSAWVLYASLAVLIVALMSKRKPRYRPEVDETETQRARTESRELGRIQAKRIQVIRGKEEE